MLGPRREKNKKNICYTEGIYLNGTAKTGILTKNKSGKYNHRSVLMEMERKE